MFSKAKQQLGIILSATAAWSLAACQSTQAHYLDANGSMSFRQVGYIEKVRFDRVGANCFDAKFDTGAKTTSINAKIVEHWTDADNEQEYISFRIQLDGTLSDVLVYPVERWAKIKKKDSDDFIRRPVIMITLDINGQLITEEANLSERDHFNYDALIGRNTIEAGGFIVNPALKNTFKADMCNAKRYRKVLQTASYSFD